MKTKQQTLTYPRLKSVFNYQESKHVSRNPSDLDPLTVTVGTVTHVLLNK